MFWVKFWAEHRPGIVTAGTLLFIFVAVILSNKDPTSSAPAVHQNDASTYSIPHNKPDASDWTDADMWFRSCLSGVIRSGLSNGYNFGDLGENAVKHGSAGALFMACTMENIDWLDACKKSTRTMEPLVQ